MQTVYQCISNRFAVDSMPRCLLSLGSNLGDRRAMLGRVCKALGDIPHTRLLARSRWHRTAPVGGPSGQEYFLNGAAIVQTELDPEAVVEHLLAIELQMGRERSVRWDARVIDIDLLLYDQQVIDLPNLTIPHPRMAFRRFVLDPAAEIASFWSHPRVGWTLGRLLSYLKNAPHWVEVRSEHRHLATWLASELFQTLNFAGDVREQTALESTDPAQRVTRIALPIPMEGVPMEGGGVQATGHSHELFPAFVILVETCSSESLLVAPGIVNERNEKKISKKKLLKVEKKTFLDCPGPQVILRSNDPEFIRQEALAALHAMWPNMSE